MENWITENRLILINKPDDPDTFYSRTWRTTSTSDLAIATDDIQGIAEREVSSQLGGSDHRPVIISIKGQSQPHRKKLPASWNYTQKSHPKMVNPRDIAGERRRRVRYSMRNQHLGLSPPRSCPTGRIYLPLE